MAAGAVPPRVAEAWLQHSELLPRPKTMTMTMTMTMEMMVGQTPCASCSCTNAPCLHACSLSLSCCRALAVALSCHGACALLTVEVDKHPIGIILKSNTIKGIRFQVSRDHWKGSAAVYNRLPEHVIGEIPSWGGRGKDDNKINVDWVTDGSNSVEFLAVLLRPALGFKLLPYENGKTAPKAKGAAAKRRYATAICDGPYRWRGQQEGAPEARQVEVCPFEPMP